MNNQITDQSTSWDDSQQEVRDELEQTRRTLSEVSMMLTQSKAELTRLTQKNAAITAQLQMVQSQIDTMPRADIRNAYNQALDAQQRMLVMRGQLEKLQSDENSLKKQVQLLTSIDEILSGAQDKLVKGRGGSSGSELVEMMINAQEAERQRLSRQMHDGPAQALSNFVVQAEIAARLFDMDPNKAKEELNLLKSAALGTFQKVRTFISELRPMSLDDLGLVPTLRRYVDIYKETNGFDVSLNVKGIEHRLQPYLEVMIFRAMQELMSNVARHNSDHTVKVTVNVQLTIDDHLVRATVSDNGRGFSPETLEDGGGLGLKLIRERVEMLGGYLNVDAAPGQGSRITLQIPIDESALLGEG